jgi:ABC-type transport system involved in multi-copper enzyme maturation permease subunit
VSGVPGTLPLQANRSLVPGQVSRRRPVSLLSAAVSALAWNPVAARELRARMRGWHTAVLVTGYLCTVGGVGYLGYSGIEASASDVVQVGGVGSSLFTGLATAVMVSLALIVPGLVAPSISGERERHTLDLLLVTPLRPSRIVLGKMLAALAVAALLVVACAPLFCVAYLLGGVGVREVLELLAFGFVGVTALAALAMLASVSFRRVPGATVVSYLSMLALAVGPFIGAYGWAAASQPEQPVVTGTGAEGVLEALSPVMGAIALIDGNSNCGTGGLVTPVVGNLAPPVVNTCGGPAQYLTSLGPLGNWQTWEASMAFSGVVALASLGASVVVFKRRALT